MSKIRNNILEWIVLYEITINFVFSLFRVEKRNKGPTWPHIVHLSTMCHPFDKSARAAIFVYWSAKKPDWLEDVEILLFVTFRWIPLSVIRGEVENVSANQTPCGHLVFPIGPKNTNFVEDVEILLPIKFCWIQFSIFGGEVENVSAIQRSGWPSYFSDRHKNTNLVENVEILLPAKCRGISFCGFRGEVKNVSVNQRPERPCCFSDRPEKHKLRRGRWDIASCQVLLNSVQRRSRKYLSQSEAGRPSCFSDRPETHKLDCGRCDRASSQVSLNSV